MMHDVHRALADVLGIDYRGRRVTGFDVSCHIGEIVHVVVHEQLLPLRADAIAATEHRFELRLQEPRFDLDRMCEQAMGRVQALIDRRAREAVNTLRRRPH